MEVKEEEISSVVAGGAGPALAKRTGGSGGARDGNETDWGRGRESFSRRLGVGRPARRAVRASHELLEPSLKPSIQRFFSIKPSLGSVRFLRT
jgi:hypothetical protein